MASAELSRRVVKVVGYPPLSDMSDLQRREFHEALLEAATFGWDAKAGEIGTKNRKGRTVPITAPLRELLLPHLLRTGRRHDDLVFGSTATEPFEAKGLRDRADAVWTEAKLRRITLHECRHTFASYMIAAGVNVKALSTFMGHASVAFTLDRHGHLFPGAESAAGGLLDTYLGAAGGHGA